MGILPEMDCQYLEYVTPASTWGSPDQALPVISELRITDQGLVDLEKFAFVDLWETEEQLFSALL